MKPRLPVQGSLFEASIAGLEQVHGVCDLQISSCFFIYVQPVTLLVLLVVMWSPLEQFQESPNEEFVSPSGWTNGFDLWHSPRLLHNVDSHFLLISRIYKCKNGHEVYAHHPD